MLIFLITKDQGDHRDYNKMEILVVRAYNSRDEKKKVIVRRPRHRAGRYREPESIP